MRLGTGTNLFIEGYNRPSTKAFDWAITVLQRKIEEQKDIIDTTPNSLAASEISGALFQKIIDLVTSIWHCLSDVIERVESWKKDISVLFVVMAKEPCLVRKTQAAFTPKDTVRHDTLRLAKEESRTLHTNKATFKGNSAAFQLVQLYIL